MNQFGLPHFMTTVLLLSLSWSGCDRSKDKEPDSDSNNPVPSTRQVEVSEERSQQEPQNQNSEPEPLEVVGEFCSTIRQVPIFDASRDVPFPDVAGRASTAFKYSIEEVLGLESQLEMTESTGNGYEFTWVYRKKFKDSITAIETKNNGAFGWYNDVEYSFADGSRASVNGSNMTWVREDSLGKIEARIPHALRKTIQGIDARQAHNRLYVDYGIQNLTEIWGRIGDEYAKHIKDNCPVRLSRQGRRFIFTPNCSDEAEPVEFTPYQVNDIRVLRGLVHQYSTLGLISQCEGVSEKVFDALSLGSDLKQNPSQEELKRTETARQKTFADEYLTRLTGRGSRFSVDEMIGDIATLLTHRDAGFISTDNLIRVLKKPYRGRYYFGIGADIESFYHSANRNENEAKTGFIRRYTDVALTTEQAELLLFASQDHNLMSEEELKKFNLNISSQKRIYQNKISLNEYTNALLTRFPYSSGGKLYHESRVFAFLYETYRNQEMLKEEITSGLRIYKRSGNSIELNIANEDEFGLKLEEALDADFAVQELRRLGLVSN
jgi:hypothetical protein